MDAPHNRQPFNQPLTYRALRKLALAIGWQEDTSQGKGSHRAFTRNGYRMVTLPCHGEGDQYQRGMTRKLLKQILEPLNDVCSASLDGVYQVEQIERIIAERLDYLPAQMQGEYDRAIAEMKAGVEEYRYEQQSRVDGEIKAYEARRLEECEQTIHALQQDNLDQSSDLSVMLAGCLIQQRQDYKKIQGRQKSLYEELAEKQRLLKSAQDEQQTLQTQIDSLTQTESSLREQWQQVEDSQSSRIQSLQRIRKRDRFIIWGLIGLSACFAGLFIHEKLNGDRPSSTAHMQSSMESLS